MSTSANVRDPATIAHNRIAIGQLRATCIAFIIIETLFVSLRFTSRVLSTSSNVSSKAKRFAWDDGLILAAWLANLGFCVSGIIYAAASSAYYLPPVASPQLEPRLRNLIHVVWAFELLYNWAYALPKLSVLAMYLRIFTHKTTRIATWCVVGFVTATFLAFFIGIIVQCLPPSDYWSHERGGHCFNNQAFDRSLNGPSIAADLMILAIPLYSVWKLQLSLAKRVGLLLTFLTGGFGLIASCIRWAIFFDNNIHSGSIVQGVHLDIWSIVEAGVYLIAACLPPLRSLISRTRGSKWVGSQFSSLFTSRQVSNSSDSGHPLEPQVAQHQRKETVTKISPDSDLPHMGAIGGSTCQADGRTSPVDEQVRKFRALAGKQSIGVKTDVWVQ